MFPFKSAVKPEKYSLRSKIVSKTVTWSRKSGRIHAIMRSEKQRRPRKMAVMTITKENFQKEVLESKKTVLLDFWASWCMPCRMLSPLVDEIAEENAAVKVGKINVDEQQELAGAFGVMSIPTLVVMKDGKVVNQSVGVRPKQQIAAMLK
jgi:thioredoxin 1